MARVPQAQPAGALGFVSPTQGPAVFDSTRASEAFGASPSRLGEAVSGIGDAVFEEGMRRELQRLDKRSKDREFQLLEFAASQRRGNQQKPGWRVLQGDDSTEADPQFRSEMQEYIEGVAGDLEGQELEDWVSVSQTIQQREFDRMDDHVIRQEEVAAEATDDALINAKINTIADDPLNVEMVFGELNDVAFITRRRLNKQGITDLEVIEAAQRQSTGDAIALATKRLYINNAELGMRYYDAMKTNPELMTAQHRIDIETGLNTAFRAERAEFNAATALQAKLDKRQREQVADQYLQAILTAETPESLDTTKQLIIADTTLNAFGTGSKTSLINMIDADEDGDSTLENNVFNRIHLPVSDPLHMGKDDIIDMGPRLGTKATRRLLADQIKADTPEGKAKKDFIDQFSSVITRSSLVGKDPVGDVNLGRFVQDVTRAIEQAEADGVDPLTVFDNSSKEFARISNLWRPYKRSVQEITASMIGEFQGTNEIPTGAAGRVSPSIQLPPPPPETPEANELIRLEEETVGEYLKRRGLE